MRFVRNRGRKRNKEEALAGPAQLGDKRARLAGSQSSLKTTPAAERKMGRKESEDAERELEMEKFRSHYRVATRNRWTIFCFWGSKTSLERLNFLP